MEKSKKILLIPDAYHGGQSGAIVAQIAKKLLIELGNQVAIFSSDIEINGVEIDGTKLYHRKPYKGLANWNESEYRKEYERVLLQSGATTVFTLGSITNKNLCYLEIAIEKGIKVISKIFMQDFFCTKLYANNSEGPCTKCLDKSYLEAFKNKCIINKPIDYIKTANAILIRKRLEKILPKIDYVITSTNEQIGYYQRFGIPAGKCVKMPLFFDKERIKNISPTMGDYFICIAQNRIEKGFHYLTDILENCDSSIKVIAAYHNIGDAKIAIAENGFQKFIDSGMLVIEHELKWKTGLAELVAGARGVIIPSIWPTTTEFGLLEALGYGKPVFTFAVGVHSEEIINEVNGFSAKLRDCKTIAQQLNRLNGDDQLYKSVSNNAKLLFDKMTNKKQWMEILKSMGL